MTTCTNGHRNPEDAHFCATCGVALESRCPSCGAAIDAGVRFCPSCGSPVGGAHPGSELAAGLTERRVVTALFADVVRSTALGERLDPEDLSDVLGNFFTAMRAEIEAEGGTVEKFIGDAVMAVFGAPVAHEDDASRAVRAALRMRERLESVNHDLGSAHGVNLQIRIGINTGEVLAEASPRPGEPLVTGEAVIIAARLEEMAGPGDILVSERTARAARGVTGFRDEGTHTLSGKADEVHVFVQVEDQAPPERGLAGLSSPIIGRDDELALLRSLVERATSEGQPQVVTVYGEPGVGKSRLIREFVATTGDLDPQPTVLRGRCLPYGDGVTYWPLAEILKNYSEVLDTDEAGSARDKIYDRVCSLLPPDQIPAPAALAAALAYTVGVEDPTHDLAGMEPRRLRAETHSAWRGFFSALARSRPVIAVIEDIHWADDALLDLLDDVAERGRGALLLLCSSRPELISTHPQWGGGRRNFSSIGLDPLTESESRSLVEHLLTVDGLPARVRRRILARAEGNPFFLEEIIGGLIDQEHVVRKGDRWVAGSGIDEVVIPDTVQGVLAARVDLLAPAERKILQAASVVGRVFWPGPIRRLLNGEGSHLYEALDVLEERDLVRSVLRSSMAGQAEYSFKHILTRDVAYESLPRRERAHAHAAVAGWIEEATGQRVSEFCELLAYHYEAAFRASTDDPRSDPAEAAGYRERAFAELIRASREALQRFAMHKARQLGERALELAADDAERAQALEQAGLGASWDAQGTMAWDYLTRAADILATLGPPARQALVRVCAHALEMPTRFPGAMDPPLPSEEEVAAYAELALANLDDEGSEDGVRIRTAEAFHPFSVAARRVVSQDEYSVALGHAMEAADAAAKLGRPDLESAALDAAVSSLIGQGLYKRAERLNERRVGLAARIDDPGERGDIFAMSAWTQIGLGRYRRGADFALEGISRVGDDRHIVTAHLSSWQAQCCLQLGEWDEITEHLFPTILAILGERADDPPGFLVPAFGACAFVWISRNDRRAERLEELMENKALTDHPAPQIAFNHALLLDRRGETERALAQVRDSGGDRDDMFMPWFGPFIARLLAQTQAWDEVPDFLADARAYVEKSGAMAMAAHLDRLEGRAQLALGEDAEAAATLRRATDGFQALGATWEQKCTALSLAEALRRTGREQEAFAETTAALKIFEALGSLSEIAQARDFLRGEA